MPIHESHLRCREIDSFLAIVNRELNGLIGEKREANSDWNELSDLDRLDEIMGIKHDYLEHLPEKPSCNLASMLETMNTRSDNLEELMNFYGVDTLTAYIRCRSRASDIQRIPASSYNREDFELMVKKGLARKGKDIPENDILQSLTLKEMNEMAWNLV